MPAVQSSPSAHCFALEEHLSLPWLRGQIQALPASDPWQRKAQLSLREQLDRTLGVHCTRVLQSSPTTIDTALAAWLQDNDQPLQRWRNTLREIQTASSQSLAMLSVAVQELALMV